jgi:murein DD-endopeptidase MepM/ murein hydrolase activator NlpD
MAHRVILCAFLGLLLAACSAAESPFFGGPRTSPPVTLTATPTSPPVTRTVPPPDTPAPSPSPSASPTPTSPPFAACSPLLGIPSRDLAGIVANPYDPPPLGSDDPHQGVDLAQVQSGIALSGLPVQVVLPGRVVLAISGRFPYGNALLVETPLEALPAAWLKALDLPSVPAVPEKRTSLTCPTPAAPASWDYEQRSLYLLYAHLLELPILTPGDALECGQTIGAIGQSGNALNPHLHLEVRVGPAGVRFPGMAHYDSSANPEEMAAYCQWRVSGAFLTIDPLLFFHGAN